MITGRTRTAVVVVALLCMAAAIFSPGCGGGGSGGGSSSPGSYSGYVDTGAVARQAIADRSAGLTGLGGASVSFAGQTYTANDSGRFSFADIEPGNYYEATAVKDSITLKGYVNISSGQAKTKNINARTTAAAMAYGRLVSEGLLGGIPTSPETIEYSALISGVESEIEAALGNGSYDFNTVLNGANVAQVVSRIRAGGSFSDTTSPQLTFSYPGEDAAKSDLEFQDESFYLEFGYSDSGAPMYGSTLSVTFTMEGEQARDITEYFSAVDATTIRSTDLDQFTGSLFNFTQYDQTHEMTVSVSIEDASGNRGSITGTFSVYPSGPPQQ